MLKMLKILLTEDKYTMSFENLLLRTTSVSSAEYLYSQYKEEFEAQILSLKTNWYDLLIFHNSKINKIPKNIILEHSNISEKIFMALYHNYLEECYKRGEFTLNQIITSTIYVSVYDFKMTIMDMAIILGNINKSDWLCDLGYDIFHHDYINAIYFSVFSNNISMIQYVINNIIGLLNDDQKNSLLSFSINRRIKKETIAFITKELDL